MFRFLGCFVVRFAGRLVGRLCRCWLFLLGEELELLEDDEEEDFLSEVELEVRCHPGPDLLSDDEVEVCSHPGPVLRTVVLCWPGWPRLDESTILSAPLALSR